MKKTMKFIFPNGNCKVSPVFNWSRSQDDDFFEEYLGSDRDIFNSDVESNGKLIIVTWFEDLLDPNLIIKDINSFLKCDIPLFELWS